MSSVFLPFFCFLPRPVSSGYLPENSSFRPAPWSEFLVACVSLMGGRRKGNSCAELGVRYAWPAPRACVFFFSCPPAPERATWHGPDFELHTLQRTHARLHTPRSAHLFAVTLGLQPRAATSDALAHCLGLQPSLAPSPVPAAAPAPRLLRTALAANRPLLLPSALCPRASPTEPHLHTAASRQQPAAIPSSSQRYRFLPLPNPVKLAFAIFFSPTPSSSPVVPFSIHLTRLILQRQGSVPADRSIRGRRHPNETTVLDCILSIVAVNTASSRLFLFICLALRHPTTVRSTSACGPRVFTSNDYSEATRLYTGCIVSSNSVDQLLSSVRMSFDRLASHK